MATNFPGSKILSDQSEKVVELEMRLSVMEKAFDELSDMVTEQWQTIERLKSKLKVMESQLEGKQDRAEGTGHEPPPPHY